jgi:16S rRNA (guanine527-N7)-methyltransferase
LREFPELLEKALAGRIALTEAQAAALGAHCDLMLRWNARLNLTSITSPAEVVERHYCESLFLADHLPAGAWSVADVGSGAGFPGIPVAILRPDCRVTLIESHRRKAVFLREATRTLPNVRILAARADSITETFDCVISRAVAYHDLLPFLQARSRRAALLTGAVMGEQMPGYTWEVSFPLPWGRERLLWIGRNPVEF